LDDGGADDDSVDDEIESSDSHCKDGTNGENEKRSVIKYSGKDNIQEKY